MHGPFLTVKLHRRVLYAATASVLSVVAVAIASGAGGSDAAPQADVRVTGLSGALTAGDGPAGTVLQITGLGPGQSADGTVTVVNRGASGGLLTLSAPAVSDAPGSGGGALSERLQVTVLDVTGSGAPELVYSGSVAAMRARTLDCYVLTPPARPAATSWARASSPAAGPRRPRAATTPTRADPPAGRWRSGAR